MSPALTYTKIYTKIVIVQETYHNLVRELIKKIASLLPKNQVEYDLLTTIDAQIIAIDRHISKLEEIKYFLSLSVLTNGASIQDSDLTAALILIEEMTSIAKIELTSSETFVQSWATKKIELFDDAKEALYQVFQHKVERATKVGIINIH